MPRPRKTNPENLPPRVYKHGRKYRYHPPNGKPVVLGTTPDEARRRWAELLGAAPAAAMDTIQALWARYVAQELPKKAPATQASTTQAMKPILRVFGEMRAGDIKPHHAIEYLDRRGNVQANREIKCLRALLTKAAHWGLVERNPLLGLHYRNPEPQRDLYVTDDELAYAIEHAPTPWMSALVWVAYLTGLRRRDLLALTRFQLQDDGVLVTESKTGKRVVIEWTEELRRVVDAALAASPDQRLFPVTESAVNNAWGRFQRQLAAEGQRRFTLRDVRAKHATDFEASGGDATKQLGHSARSVTARHYLRAPRRMRPIR